MNIPYEQIFSARKAKMQEKFFLAKIHQQMSHASDEKIDNDNDNEAFFPCHHELTFEIPKEKSTSSSKLVEESFSNVSALELDDDDIAEGRVEELDDNAFKDVELPVFDDDQLQRIRSMQDDETSRQCQDLLKEKCNITNKTRCLS